MDCPCHRTWLFYFHNILKIQTFILIESLITVYPDYGETPLDGGPEKARPCHGIRLFLYQRYAERYLFFSNFSADGLHDWGILLLALFKFTVDKEKGSVIVYGCFISTVR